jgi:hypothetical protein
MTPAPVQTLSRTFVFLATLLGSSQAYADWYYYVMKIVCAKDELRIIDYSAYNEEGKARAAEPGAIDVDTLSTWRRTSNDLNVPDKPLPRVTICNIHAGKYQVVLTNAGGGYSAPYPVVNVREISDPKQPKVLFRDVELDKSYEYKRYEIVFSSRYPKGQIIDEK